MKKDGKDGEYTDNFIFWCAETEDLDDEQWAHAFKMVEQEVVSKRRSGDEAWPPSYAIFLDMAKLERPFHIPRKAITDQGAQEANRMANIKRMKEMRGKLRL